MAPRVSQGMGADGLRPATSLFATTSRITAPSSGTIGSSSKADRTRKSATERLEVGGRKVHGEVEPLLVHPLHFRLAGQ